MRWIGPVAIGIAAAAACGTRAADAPVGPDQFQTDGGAARGLDANDPLTCEDAKERRSYVGCDYWPTVTANGVWSLFDFAAVVANTGIANAEISVTGPNGVDKRVTVPPRELRKIFLPWVASLKGGDSDACTATVPITESVVEAN